ncbi:MAG: LLM class F420-dependent oxidoreductase, partial [Chloroflexi bacterium]
QAISGGRFVLGIGAGWNEEEYLAYGWPYPSARVRIAQLAEAIQLIRAMWTEAPASYHGQYYQVANAYNEPRSGEKYLLRVVAQHADWWNYGFRDAESYTHKQAVLKEHCREVGRDYEEITQVIRAGILIAESETALKQLRGQPHVRPMGDGGITGTPEQVTEMLLGIIEQGAGRLTVHFVDSPG